jgi:hypothetical protein
VVRTVSLYTNQVILVFKGLVASSVTQIDESRLVNYKMEITWKGEIVNSVGHRPGICVVTLIKTKGNDSQKRNWKLKLQNRPEHHPLDGAKFGM